MQADDLRQEILVAVWQSLPSWRQQASLKTFVARIAHNVAISHVRRSVRQPRTSMLDPDLTSTLDRPDTTAERNNLAARLRVAVAGLPIGLRQAISLYLEDFSHAEIAATLGISETAVAVRINRGKAALQQRMQAP